MTVYAESPFAVVDLKCWNALPAHIRSTESETVFKRKIITILFLYNCII